MHRRIFALSVVVFGLATPFANAASGPGRVAHPGLGASSAVLPLAGGGYLVAGREARNHDHPLIGKRLVVARLRADGSLDFSFGTRGVSSIRLRDGDLSPGQLLLQDDGDVVVVRVPPNGGAVDLVGLTPRGGLDRGFGSRGVAFPGVDATCRTCAAAALAADGSIVVAGRRKAVGGGVESIVVRLTPSGTPVEGVTPIVLPGAGGNGFVGVSVVGGRVLVAYSAADGARIAALSDRALDPSFGAGSGWASIPGFPQAMIVRPTGAIDVLATRDELGLVPRRRSARIVRLTAAGVPDLAFGAGGSVAFTPSVNGLVVAMLPAGEGTALFEGAFGSGYLEPLYVQRFGADGRPAPTARVLPRFGGGSGPGAFNTNAFGATVVVSRSRSSYAVFGAVDIRKLTEGGGYGTAIFAAAAFSLPAPASAPDRPPREPDGTLEGPLSMPDRSFGGALREPRVTIRPTMSDTAAFARTGAIPVRVTTSMPGLVRLTLRTSRGQTIGSATTPIFSVGTSVRAIYLSDAGQRILTGSRGLRVTIAHDFRDVLVGRSRASTTIRLP